MTMSEHTRSFAKDNMIYDGDSIHHKSDKKVQARIKTKAITAALSKKKGSKIKDSHFGINPKNNQWEYLGKPKGQHKKLPK